ncbi:glycoside hydrolase family 73 protein [Pseudoduganella violacea]|uniref:Flagellar protein FlgJ n=1 Tax=Pseudoduganella violacea TaxID=1715466 RepID=A0A7W5BCX7_9BURK|nr:glucosaminidase domain-containing protein [Pseudoduganella violacea]MBB3120819.1 flagellar protein FlgJ [Pseudoduganella violacea]
MNRSDFFARTSATQATAATQATRSNMGATQAVLPAAFTSAGGDAGQRFGAAFRQVQSEVQDFLAHGAGFSAPDNGAGSALSVEAAALRARLAGGAIDGNTPAGAANGVDGETQEQFLANIKPWAAEAGERLGVAPDIVAAHAALESGWGQRPLRLPGGADSNNLFGIKAGGQWQGEVNPARTTEYEGGVAMKKVERFRSYPDQGAAFRDYASLLLDNPRYQKALHAGNNARAFAQGLVQGGYATDPGYAEKLTRLAARIAQRPED